MTLVSVIVPLFNRRLLIEETLRSALTQSYRDMEIIVVDDGSTDGSAELVECTFGNAVRLVRLERNQGSSVARNVGCEAARGEFIAFLDSDDLWDATKLSRQLPAFDDPAVVLVHCRVREIDGTGALRARESSTILRAFEIAEARGYDYAGITTTWCRLYTPTVVVRRSILARTGGFDPALAHFEDWDLFWRIAKEGTVVTVPEVLASVRVHADNMQPRWAECAAPFIRVAEKHLGALSAPVTSHWDTTSRSTGTAAIMRRARHNLLMNRALGELWRGDRAAVRRWLLRALRVDARVLLRPWHPTWGALLLHAMLPDTLADRLAAILGVDRYRGRAGS